MKTIARFYATWCQPCKNMEPIYDDAKKQFPDYSYIDIDIDLNPQTRIDYNVRSVPTVMMLEGKDEVKRLVGGASLSELKEWLANEPGTV